MSSKKCFGLVVILSLFAFSGVSQAQSLFEPGNSSAHQVTNNEAPVVQSSAVSVVRPDFGLMGMALLWAQASWLPASPMQMPSLALFMTRGDRRWGLR
jgi:hypothetical protein